MDPSFALSAAKDAVVALPRDAAYVGVGVLLLVIARAIKDWLTPFNLREQMTAKDNPAVGISVAGYYVGVMVVLVGPYMTPMREPVPLHLDLIATFAYAFLGILLLNVSRFMVDRLLLRDFSTVKEIIEDRNVGTGAVEMGAYVASGLVVAGSLYGHGGGPHTAVVFFLVGQLGLLLYGHLYRVVCRYDLHGEIEKDNVAAGVALGTNLVAAGVVLMKGVGGDFIDWEHHFVRIGTTFVIGIAFLLLLRFVVDAVLLPGVRMHDEIVNDRNTNAAWVEGTALTGMAGILATIL